ncbi:MAG: hypothetical protein WCS43_16430 [Verrucomicrobiota bacterium]
METTTSTVTIPSREITQADRQLIEFYSDRLKFLWEQYLKVVHLVLTLSGGTILLLLNTLKIAHGKDLTSGQVFCSWTAIACSVGALAGGIVWRSCAQVVMEAQIYGPPDAAERYFTKLTVPTILPVALRSKDLKKYGLAYDIIKWFVLALLVGSWIAIIFFLASGAPPPVKPEMLSSL